MLRRTKIVWFILLFAMMVVIGIMPGTTVAQKQAVPKPQDKLALGENDVKQLLLLMHTDENGKISKQEFMKFMDAEFERLDRDKRGELDVKELKQSKLRVGRFTDAGK